MDSFFQPVWSQIKALRPAFLAQKPHFDFITAHYVFIIGLTILASVLIFGAGHGQVAYIDALVFAAGANTQAGLNTIDINLLNTFQQVCLFVFASTSNPITINSFVVFLRLYWFEKRFQHVVREAKLRRGTISKSKSKAKPDNNWMERGVDGRNISVMRNGENQRITNDGILLWGKAESANGSSPGGEVDPRTIVSSPPESRRMDIRFADTVRRSDDAGLVEARHLSLARPDHDHIAILQRQRNEDDNEVLRIPGPRDADRGLGPQRVQRTAEGDEPLDQVDGGRPRSPDSVRNVEQPQTVENRHPAITIEEPTREIKHETTAEDIIDDARAFGNVMSIFRVRKPRLFSRKSRKYHKDDDAVHVAPSKTRRRQTLAALKTVLSREKEEETPYLSWQPTLGRNSAFPGLTEEQREELGGIEYRSLKTLALVLTCYFWGFAALGIVILVPWILHSTTYGPVVDGDGQGRVWWGIFTPHSAFTDLGFTLTPDSMNSFNTAILPMLLMSFLIVIGNTGFPVMLRFVIWFTSAVIPRGTGLYEELRFLLDHPRRCFTLLFPSGATWWLFWLLVVLNGVDLVFFIILDLGSGPVVGFPPGIRVLDGLFQATSTRTAGFSCVNLGDLHPAVQVSYMIMMYISVFPIAISVRRTNVYEEKSLGIYVNNEEEQEANISDLSYVGAHLRRQLSFDLWYIFVGLFILAISEGPRLQSGDIQLFAVLFEVVSAYGTVGLSLGYPTVNASLCSQFSVVGKLVIVAMMLRGRHRGLPYGLDRAILLPSESLNAKEAADADARGPRRSSAAIASDSGGNSTNGAAEAGRRRSRSQRRSSVGGDRTSVLAQLLQPGPILTRDTAYIHGVKRSVTEPAPGQEDEAVDARLGPSHRVDVHAAGRSAQQGLFQP